MLAASALGGTRSIWAAPIACAILVIGPDKVSAFNKYSVLAYGVLLMVVGVGFSCWPGWRRRQPATAVRGPLRARYWPAGSEATAQEPGEAAGVARGAATSESTSALAIKGGILLTKGVSKAFGGVNALRGVDFQAKPGEITAIIGANGAGKTTLLNAISGLIAIDAARYLGNGRSRVAADKSRAPESRGRSRRRRFPKHCRCSTWLQLADRRTLDPVDRGRFRSPRYRGYSARIRSRSRRALIRRPRARREHSAHLCRSGADGSSRSHVDRRRASVVLFDEPAAGLDPEMLESLAQSCANCGTRGPPWS